MTWLSKKKKRKVFPDGTVEEGEVSPLETVQIPIIFYSLI